MDTSIGRRRAHRLVETTETEMKGCDFLHDISLYNWFPDECKVDIAEFENLAVERLQLLRTFEEATLKGHRPFSEDWKQYIKQELAKLGLRKFLRLLSGYCSQTEQDVQARRADCLSHFILRFTYCRSEDLKRWFLNREMEYFKMKFLAQSSQSIQKFLELNNLKYSPIPVEVKEKLRQRLLWSTAGLSERDFHAAEFYKVPFPEVLPLVKNRKVYVEKCYAFIPASELVVSIQAQFRTHLSEALSVYNQRLPELDDDRITDLTNNLHTVYTGNAHVYDESKERAINPTNLDAYSKQHFPMCMKNLYDVLKTTHHLKHFGRLQLLLFLKGIGLSYEDALSFWKSQFTKNPKIDENKFDKDYSYNVRHSYGKVGSMINYTPHSCIKIIMSNVGPGDQHGCPFKHWDASILKHTLTESGLNTQNVNSVMEMVTGGHYQIACSRYYEFLNGQAPQSMISHPNQYFSESSNFAKDKQAKKNLG